MLILIRENPMKRSKTIKIKNELPELLEAVCRHRDCEDWLRDAIWDAFNNQTMSVLFTASYWRTSMEAIADSKEPDSRDRGPFKPKEPNEPYSLN
jgi:hypothetical protein